MAKAKDTAKRENPLLSKNIPQPPSAAPDAETAEREETTIPQSGNTVMLQKAVKPQTTAKREKITFYLEPEQAGKLYDLMEAFRKRTGIKISQQNMLRRIIDVTIPETVLP